MIWIITPVDFVWSQTLLYGASVLKDIYRYPPNTRRYKLLGQRVGFFGERICFGGSMNFGKSNPACGISLQVNLIAEIASIIKLTSTLLLSWAYLAVSLPVYCLTQVKSLICLIEVMIIIAQFVFILIEHEVIPWFSRKYAQTKKNNVCFRRCIEMTEFAVYILAIMLVFHENPGEPIQIPSENPGEPIEIPSAAHEPTTKTVTVEIGTALKRKFKVTSSEDLHEQVSSVIKQNRFFMHDVTSGNSGKRMYADTDIDDGMLIKISPIGRGGMRKGWSRKMRRHPR